MLQRFILEAGEFEKLVNGDVVEIKTGSGVIQIVLSEISYSNMRMYISKAETAANALGKKRDISCNTHAELFLKQQEGMRRYREGTYLRDPKPLQET